MDKEQEVSFVCYNCGQKNVFDKFKYASKNGISPGSGVKEVSIECKSCREVNVIKVEI
jgi:hypothetical protein